MPVISQRMLFVALLAGGTPLSAQNTNPTPRCASVADFVDVVGRDTISRSRVALTDSTFESTSHDVAQGALVRYGGRLSATGDIQTLHLEIWPQIADSARAPAQIADVTVQGGDVLARIAAPARGMQMQRDRLPPGGVLYMTAAPLFLELLQRHVRIPVGATTAVSALWLFTGGAIDTVQVSRPSADSLRLRFPEVEYVLALAPDRSILSVISRYKEGGTEQTARMSRRDCR